MNPAPRHGNAGISTSTLISGTFSSKLLLDNFIVVIHIFVRLKVEIAEHYLK